jgi:hypothetical protein
MPPARRCPERSRRELHLPHIDGVTAPRRGTIIKGVQHHSIPKSTQRRSCWTSSRANADTFMLEHNDGRLTNTASTSRTRRVHLFPAGKIALRGHPHDEGVPLGLRDRLIFPSVSRAAISADRQIIVELWGAECRQPIDEIMVGRDRHLSRGGAAVAPPLPGGRRAGLKRSALDPPGEPTVEFLRKSPRRSLATPPRRQARCDTAQAAPGVISSSKMARLRHLSPR